MPELLNQVYTFLLTLLIGTLLGVVIHFYQLTVRKSRLGRYFLFVIDFSLWILLIVLIFLGLVLINFGEMRVYVFIALITGVLLYYRYAARYLHYPLAAGAKVVVGGLAWSNKLLARPLRRLANKIKAYYARKAQEDDSRDID